MKSSGQLSNFILFVKNGSDHGVSIILSKHFAVEKFFVLRDGSLEVVGSVRRYHNQHAKLIFVSSKNIQSPQFMLGGSKICIGVL